jgi:AraC-like DNA-binding protein
MKTPKRKRDWDSEQVSFLAEISPHWHFYRVFDGLPGIYFFAKNRAGETLFCSSNLPANHGLEDESAMLGKTDHELTPGPLAVKYLSDDAEIYRTGQPLPPTMEHCIDHVGLPNWYRTCKYPIKNRAGDIIGIMGTFQLANDPGLPSNDFADLERARLFLGNDLCHFPSIKSLAELAGMSVRNFQRQFQDLYRMSPRTYWMKLRIRQACYKIREDDQSLLQVAHELGFYDQSAFTKHFRKHAGMSPKQYARKLGTSR